MKVATTTGDFLRYYNTQEERISALYRAGFRYIDLSMFDETEICDYMQDDWKEKVQSLKRVADDLGMHFVQMHSPTGGSTIVQNDFFPTLLARTIRSIEICGLLGIKNTVSHPGGRKGATKEEYFEKNKEYYEKLFPVMEKYGVNMLVENTTRVHSKDDYYIVTGQDLREFCDYVNHPLLHACWDTGHANCEGSQYDEILAMGKHLKAIHYNDNHGTKDEHLPPYFGTLNHDEVINALIDVDYEGYFTLEAGSPFVPKRGYYYSRRPFEKNQTLACPHVCMQEYIERYMFETSKYMLTAYGLYEE